MHESQTRTDAVNEILRRLPRRNLRHYWDNTALIWKTLTEIESDMTGLILTTQDVSVEHRSEEIRLLLESVVLRLRGIRASFQKVVKCLDAVIEYISTDWDKDVKEISQGCLGNTP